MLRFIHLAYVSLVVSGYGMLLHLALRLYNIFYRDMRWVPGASVFRVLRSNPEDHQWGEARPRALTQRVMKPRGMLTANCTWVCVCVQIQRYVNANTCFQTCMCVGGEVTLWLTGQMGQQLQERQLIHTEWHWRKNYL